MFADLNDRFGDSIKTSLSMRDITIKCVIGSNPSISHWDELYKEYMLKNPYNYMGKQFGLENFLISLPPVSILYTRLLAHLITLTGPSEIVAFQATVYLLAICIIILFMHKSLLIWHQTNFVFGALALFSMPAIFMLNRGHYLSAFTFLNLFVYAFTKYKNSYRGLGLFCIAIAINLRPNLAAFLLLELFPVQNLFSIIRRLLIALLVIGSLFAISYLVAIKDWPEYSFSKFLIGLKAYYFYYVLNDGGLEFGASLLGMMKILRQALGFQPLYLPEINTPINILGLILVICSCWMVWKRKIDIPQACFLSACITALFCPVYAYYHCLIFVIPLCLNLEKLKNLESVTAVDAAVIVASTVPLICIPDWRVLGCIVPITLLGGLLWVLISKAKLLSKYASR
jgi:hypothetical protein